MARERTVGRSVSERLAALETRSEDQHSRGERMEAALGRIETTVARSGGTVETFVSQMKVQDERATGLEVRVRRVENRQHWWGGVGALLGAILGAFGVHLRPGL
jgi:hypothetical protein